MQGMGAVTKPIVATIITPCIFDCITPYDSQAIARYMSWKIEGGFIRWVLQLLETQNTKEKI